MRERLAIVAHVVDEGIGSDKSELAREPAQALRFRQTSALARQDRVASPDCRPRSQGSSWAGLGADKATLSVRLEGSLVDRVDGERNLRSPWATMAHRRCRLSAEV